MITVAIADNPELITTLIQGVREHTHQQLGDETPLPLLMEARSSTGELVGGIAGRTIYRKWLIDTLWVSEAYRGEGIGSQLMSAAAIARGCKMAQVDTLSIQAPNFYVKLGFFIAGVMPGFTGCPAQYFLIKNLYSNE